MGGKDNVITIKTNSEGDEEWYETASGAIFYSIKQTTDSGYIITGYTQETDSYNFDIWLIKIEGNLICIPGDVNNDSLLDVLDIVS
ncbi:MAG: hypothetical protein QGG87_05835, partial [Nitrospinota bacterium]|nr:hypothetical protein [Nitrospinota bacterium]